MYTKAHFDFDQLPLWVTTLRKELKLERVAVGLIHVPRGKGYPYMHSHSEQEEVYIVIEGSGLIHIEGENIPLKKGDLVKVSPSAQRALKASDKSDLIVICTGGVTKGYPKNPESRVFIDDGIPDFDYLPPWCAGNEKIIAYNQRLKKERLKR